MSSLHRGEHIAHHCREAFALGGREEGLRVVLARRTCEELCSVCARGGGRGEARGGEGESRGGGAGGVVGRRRGRGCERTVEDARSVGLDTVDSVDSVEWTRVDSSGLEWTSFFF